VLVSVIGSAFMRGTTGRTGLPLNRL
jgi:hypothetical protein